MTAQALLAPKSWTDYFIVMQVDRVGWHGAKALVVPENTRVIPQPAYSPL